MRLRVPRIGWKLQGVRETDQIFAEQGAAALSVGIIEEEIGGVATPRFVPLEVAKVGDKYRPVTSASTPKIESHVEIRPDIVAGSGGVEDVDFTPPEGHEWQVVSIACDIPKPIGAVSGTHSLSFMALVTVPDMGVMEACAWGYGSSTYDDMIQLQYQVWNHATILALPDVNLSTAIRNMVITHDIPLRMKYINSTNADNTGTRMYAILTRDMQI